jgi:hypothetical protein
MQKYTNLPAGPHRPCIGQRMLRRTRMWARFAGIAALAAVLWIGMTAVLWWITRDRSQRRPHPAAGPVSAIAVSIVTLASPPLRRRPERNEQSPQTELQRAGCRGSVMMRVVGVRHVGMFMSNRLMLVPVTVRAQRHRIVRMIVMPVVVTMGVLMLDRLMFVLVVM